MTAASKSPGAARQREPLAHPPRLYEPGLGADTAVPASGLTLTMHHAASMKVSVDFTDNRAAAPSTSSTSLPRGHQVGSWGGSSQIDDDDSTTFTQIPPGR